MTPPTPVRTRTRVALAVRCALGALMLWAAVSKLANPTEFLGALYAYDLPLPRVAFKTAAVVLPWVELLCGLCLLAGVWTETVLALVGALFLVFLVATGQAVLRGLEISCGCFDLHVFGLDQKAPGLVKFLESPGFAFVRNAVLFGGIAWLFREAGASAAAVPSPPSAGKATLDVAAASPHPVHASGGRRNKRQRR